MTRVAATLHGYANVAHAAAVLHLAPRSVRDLIYAGRLPSLRVGRLHYVKASDLEVERRRRLNLPLPKPRSRRPQSAQRPRSVTELQSRRLHTDSGARRVRAAKRALERAALVRRWREHQRLDTGEPQLPFAFRSVVAPTTCAVCRRDVRHGRVFEHFDAARGSAAPLCLPCGRRALLDWADARRTEAAAARRLARAVGEPVAGSELQVA